MSILPRPTISCLGNVSSKSILATTYVPFRRKAIPRSQRTPKRWQSTEHAAPTNPKILGIVDQISQLTLLETADLISTLKTRLNIPDIPLGGIVGGAGGQPASVATVASPVEEDEPAPKTEEKTLFALKLQSFDAAAKPKIIKEIKQLLNLSLVDSKKFVESAPKLMKEGVTKDEAEKIVETLKGLGAIVAVE